MNEIDLPDDGRPATIEEKLRAAVYQASMYYWPTKITYGHRTVYLIDEWTWKRLAAAAERAAELVPPPSHMSTLCVCGQNQQTAPFPGGNMFAAHSDAAGDPCPGLPLPFPPTVQEADRG